MRDKVKISSVRLVRCPCVRVVRYLLTTNNTNHYTTNCASPNLSDSKISRSTRYSDIIAEQFEFLMMNERLNYEELREIALCNGIPDNRVAIGLWAKENRYIKHHSTDRRSNKQFYYYERK